MTTLRPKFHITANKNWINDPNGLVKYKGEYHIFMQHHPYGISWGPMHWYHVTSKDLIHFKHLPIALTPGDIFDRDGCFSGSSLVDNNRLYIAYTGFVCLEPEDNIQQQCLAYSDDGINFTKLGVIIDKTKLPKGYASNDFRDPKLFKNNDTYYILTACRKLDGRGRILLFQSKDILNWEFVSDILDSDSSGTMIECPDYIKELGVLMYCEQFQPIDGYMHHNIHSTFYRLGEFINNKFITTSTGTVDYGFDFYAPQSISNENIIIGWMDMWGRNQPSEKYGFAGQLTYPRYISIKNNKLYQIPIIPKVDAQRLEFDDIYQEHVRCGFYKLEIKNLKEFSLIIREGKEHNTTFVLNNHEWIFDRSNSGISIYGDEKDEDSLKGIRRMPLEQLDEHEIYIVLDEFSVEIFVDGMSMTSTIYPDLEDDLLTLNIKCKNKIMTKYNIE